MSTATEEDRRVEDRVAPDVLERMSFFTGANLNHLRNVALNFVFQGKRYTVEIDGDGRATIVEAK